MNTCRTCEREIADEYLFCSAYCAEQWPDDQPIPPVIVDDSDEDRLLRPVSRRDTLSS